MGKPLYTYSYTSNLEKIWYAKILIEVIVAQPLPNSFLIESSSGPWEQPIDYKWRPKFCNDCLIYGHDSKAWIRTREVELKNVPAKKKNTQRRRPQKQIWQANNFTVASPTDGLSGDKTNVRMNFTPFSTNTLKMEMVITQREGK